LKICARLTPLKNLVSFAISLVAVAIFVWSGTVDWAFALLVMVSSALGGYLGGRLSVIAPQHLIRRGIIAFGCCLTLRSAGCARCEALYGQN